MTPNPSTLKLNHTGKGIHVIILGLFEFLAGGLLGGLVRSASWGKWGHFHLRCCPHWILQNQMLSNKLGLNKDPEPPVAIWIEAETPLLKEKTTSIHYNINQPISIGDHNMTTSQSQTEAAECIIIGEFIYTEKNTLQVKQLRFVHLLLC